MKSPEGDHSGVPMHSTHMTAVLPATQLESAHEIHSHCVELVCSRLHMQQAPAMNLDTWSFSRMGVQITSMGMVISVPYMELSSSEMRHKKLACDSMHKLSVCLHPV